MSAAVSSNLLLSDIQYAIQQTSNGVWRRYLYPNGQQFAEFKTHLKLAGLPLVHYTYGICPETGRRITAHGIVAVGRVANGIVAVGRVALGLIAVGQLSIGLLLGIGQATFGTFCIGQLAIGLMFGLGQAAVGQIAIGQFAYGINVLAQVGWGTHVVDMRGVDPVAKNFFLHLIGQ